MSAFAVEETLLEGTWTVAIMHGGELVGVGQGVTVQEARADALLDMDLDDYIEFENSQVA